jgi:hypothetical protein
VQTLLAVLRDPEHSLKTLDISGNELTYDHLEQMRHCLTTNKRLTSLDIRSNPGYAEGN